MGSPIFQWILFLIVKILVQVLLSIWLNQKRSSKISKQVPTYFKQCLTGLPKFNFCCLSWWLSGISHHILNLGQVRKCYVFHQRTGYKNRHNILCLWLQDHLEPLLVYIFGGSCEYLRLTIENYCEINCGLNQVYSTPFMKYKIFF